jgi:hypothetical protein
LALNAGKIADRTYNFPAMQKRREIMRDSIHFIIVFAVIAIEISCIGCSKGTYSRTDKKSNLKSILSQLHGDFTWRDDLGRYDYSEKLKIEEALSTQSPEKTVDIFVDCLDSTSESQSRIDNKPASLGIICYEALTQLVYYEPTTADGDISQNWPGYISPKSSFQEMQKAKQAWKKVIETKSYIFQ